MSWLLFMDESGHDHQSMPYEVRGGLAIHSSKLWEFTKHIQSLEIQFFGMLRHEFGSEIKGDILLKKRRFSYSAQSGTLSTVERRELTTGFLKSTTQQKSPRGNELKAYSETCIEFSHKVLDALREYDCYVFASFIPPKKAPKGSPPPEDYLRKDHVFLLERYFYFLKSKKDFGLIVMDGTEKRSDRRFIKGLERYFQNTKTGKERSKQIVPVPFFVESDMGYGVQVADLCIYCLNCAYRVPGIGLDAACRQEIQPYTEKIQNRIWQGNIRKNERRHHLFSVVYVPDPYTSRSEEE